MYKPLPPMEMLDGEWYIDLAGLCTLLNDPNCEGYSIYVEPYRQEN